MYGNVVNVLVDVNKIVKVLLRNMDVSEIIFLNNIFKIEKKCKF